MSWQFLIMILDGGSGMVILIMIILIMIVDNDSGMITLIMRGGWGRKQSWSMPRPSLTHCTAQLQLPHCITTLHYAATISTSSNTLHWNTFATLHFNAFATLHCTMPHYHLFCYIALHPDTLQHASLHLLHAYMIYHINSVLIRCNVPNTTCRLQSVLHFILMCFAPIYCTLLLCRLNLHCTEGYSAK